MPSTRKRLARGRRLPIMSLAMTDLLLGVRRSQPEIERLIASGQDYDQWLEFDDIPSATLDALVQAHRPALAREAKRRGVVPPWAARVGTPAGTVGQ